ncbi:MAG TPA: methyltransferase domain-containing protein [Pyrinomonadaceae bacterium]|jgi:ubiquinone/menaquinone biosynthesis C-methylase UbiE
MNEPAECSEIATAYNDWAETYDTDQNRTRDLAAEVLRQTKINFAGRKVIEVGCGTGRNTEWLAERASEIVALDFSEHMLAKARARVTNPRVHFVQHDARRKWPLPDASADIVVAMLILEHLSNLATFFAEAARVLMSGGSLFSCELHPMRQLAGGQAQFSDATTGERQRIAAFLHDVSEYVNTGLAAGFALQQLGEWRDADAPIDSMPRLLSLHFNLL